MNSLDTERIRTGMLIYAIERQWHRHFDQHVRHLAGITRSQWWLLINLMRHPDTGMPQTQLAEILGVGKVPLGKMVDRLQRAGLIDRLPQDQDRRCKRVRINANGRSLVKRMEVVAADLSRQVMCQLDDEQLLSLNRLLLSMKDNLKTLGAPDWRDSTPHHPAPANPNGRQRRLAA